MFLLQCLDTFLSTSCPKEIFEKDVLKNSTKFSVKHLHRGLYCNKAAGWRPATASNAESCRGAFQRILRNH